MNSTVKSNRVLPDSTTRNPYNSIKMPHNDGDTKYKHKTHRLTNPMSINSINNTFEGQVVKEIQPPKEYNSLSFHPTNGRPIINPNAKGSY